MNENSHSLFYYIKLYLDFIFNKFAIVILTQESVNIKHEKHIKRQAF